MKPLKGSYFHFVGVSMYYKCYICVATTRDWSCVPGRVSAWLPSHMPGSVGSEPQTCVCFDVRILPTLLKTPSI